MGQAKQRAMSETAAVNVFQGRVDLERLSTAFRKLFASAAASPGRDCLLYASLGQALIRKLGADARIVAGHAAWRVGPNDGDMITHASSGAGWTGFHQMGDQTMFLGHAWLEIGDRILDLTTWQLPLKAKMLDEMDGGSTQVEWRPDFLFVEKSAVSGFAEARQSAHSGAFYYQAIGAIRAKVLAAIEASPYDPTDLFALEQIYRNPHIQTIGPNDIESAENEPEQPKFR